MATAAQPVPAPPIPPPPLPIEGPAPEAVDTAERALVPARRSAEALEIEPDSAVARLPVELEIGLPLRNFRVRNLLALEPGVVVASHWNHGEDLPLSAGDVQLAWAQFEVVDTILAARLTRVA